MFSRFGIGCCGFDDVVYRVVALDICLAGRCGGVYCFRVVLMCVRWFCRRCL